MQLIFPDKRLYEKLKKEMEQYGHSSVSPFIRFIIHKFFKDELKSDMET